MSRVRASGWENEELDPAGDASTPRRAKPIVRRVPARWEERDGVLCTLIGLWAVRVAQAPDRPTGWEWSAFSQGAPRALRCTGFPDPEAAQVDAEHSLTRLD
jgi:hypothetical protein